MKKNQFMTLILGVVAGLVFGIGMCMCLLPEWNMFDTGVVVTAIGGAVLLLMGIVSLVKNSKNRKPFDWKLFGKVLFAILSALVLGLGMCLILVWEMMLVGLIIGVVGIVMILCLIPMFTGFKK